MQRETPLKRGLDRSGRTERSAHLLQHLLLPGAHLLGAEPHEAASLAASAAAWAAATGHLRNASTSWAVALAVTSSLTPHMVPLGDQVVVAPDARMDGVLGKLQDGEANRVLVVEDDEVAGIITPSDMTRWLRRRRPLDSRPR